MEYIIALLVVALIAVLFFKQPSKLYDTVISSLFEMLETREGEIVYGLYNKLPASIKSKVDSKTIAEIVSFTIDVLFDVLDRRK